MKAHEIETKHRKIIAVDFDGTLNSSQYPEIGEPNEQILRLLQLEKEAGAAIILWTCREGKELKQAVDACTSWGITFDAINDNIPAIKEAYGCNPRKITATEYWDDRAFNIKGPYLFFEDNFYDDGKNV